LSPWEVRAEPKPPAPKPPASATADRSRPEPAGPDLTARLDRFLATGMLADEADADLAEAVCSLVWPNWPPYEGRLDRMEFWRLRDLLARTSVSAQVLMRLGEAERGSRSPPGRSGPGNRPGCGPPNPGQVSMIPGALPLRRPAARPP
jgi:hypothetical protein